MSLRVYSGPMEEFKPNYFRSVAGQYMQRMVVFCPSQVSGQPASNWVITIGEAQDWTAADADSRINNIFGPELAGTEQTKADLRAALQAKTLSQVGQVRADAIKARLDTLGVPYSDFDGSTTMWRLFQRVLAMLLERDFNWANGWQV